MSPCLSSQNVSNDRLTHIPDFQSKISNIAPFRLLPFRFSLPHQAANRGTFRMTTMKTLKDTTRKGTIELIQKARLKTIRRLTAARARVAVEPTTLKRDIIAEYADYGSKIYAPLQRDGRFPESRPRGQEIDPLRYIDTSKRAVLQLDQTLPPGTLKVRPELPKKPRYLDCAARQTLAAMKDVEFIGRMLETAKSTIGRGYGDCWPEPLGAAAGTDSGATARGPRIGSAGVGAGRAGSPPKGGHGGGDKKQVLRPETPTVQLQPTAEAKVEAAALLLQRLLRGRAEQMEMYQAVERSKALVRELQLREEAAALNAEAAALDARLEAADAAFGATMYEMLQLLSSDDGAQRIAELLLQDEQARLSEEAAARRAQDEAAAVIQALYRGFATRRKLAKGAAAAAARPEPTLRPQRFGGLEDAAVNNDDEVAASLLLSAEMLRLGNAEVLTLRKSLGNYPALQGPEPSATPTVPGITPPGTAAGHSISVQAGVSYVAEEGRPLTGVSSTAVEHTLEDLLSTLGVGASRGASPDRPGTTQVHADVDRTIDGLLEDLGAVRSLQGSLQLPAGAPAALSPSAVGSDTEAAVDALMDELLADEGLMELYMGMLVEEGITPQTGPPL